MSSCKKHENHQHQHGDNCGHNKIRHNDHYDFIHDGHLHHAQNNGDYHEHIIEISDQNPNICDPLMSCVDHVHGANCGHEAVPHGDHICYIVDGRLHHHHHGHCDDHGPVEVIRNAKIGQQNVNLDVLNHAEGSNSDQPGDTIE